MVGPAEKREAVAHLRTAFEMSERRATTTSARIARRSAIDRGGRTMRRCGRARAISRINAIASAISQPTGNCTAIAERRRLHVLLRRDGEAASRNKVYRLYRVEGLAVRKRKARRRAVGQRAPLVPALLANTRWSLDFVHDQLACGRRFRILNVIDDATRECLLAVADTSISGRRVVRELAALVARRGRPRMIVSDKARSSPRTPCSPGARPKASPGITSRPASRCRTPSAKASTAACVTSF